MQANKGRRAQAARTGARKLFRGKVRRDFLEWLAATANCKWAAERAGICYQTVWRHRMEDAEFAEDFDRALDQGVARMRARLLETPRPAEPIDGDWEAPEPDIDPQLAILLLREHGRAGDGPAAGMGRKQGRRPRVATNLEVRIALAKRLAAYGERERRRRGIAAPSPGSGGGTPAPAPAPAEPESGGTGGENE